MDQEIDINYQSFVAERSDGMFLVVTICGG
jgi:hypothetical protein